MRLKNLIATTFLLVTASSFTSCTLTHVSPLGTTTLEISDNPSPAERAEYYEKLEAKLAEYQDHLGEAIEAGNVTLAKAWQEAINDVLEAKGRLGIPS